jgi:hypothetical protein
MIGLQQQARLEKLKKIRLFCLEKRTAAQICVHVGISQSHAIFLTRYLRDIGYMTIIKRGEKVPFGWKAHFLTTSLADIPEIPEREEIDIKPYRPDVPKELALMMGYTSFVPRKGKRIHERMPSWANRNEKSGIGSTFSMEGF